ncbi:MAG: uracil-DNA glycosylase [Bacteroidales bacterium]
MNVNIHPSWKKVLHEEFNKPYFAKIGNSVDTDLAKGKSVYPTNKDIFAAFEQTPFEQVKVVLLGQDPYHGAGQAQGLSFSVPQGIKPPPSLQNVFKELTTDIEGFTVPTHGHLQNWATQGVFLLNSILTVRAGEAGSHSHFGWQTFTDAVIRTISQQKTGVVFLLWGKFAQKKAYLVDTQKHFVLQAAHPSPLARGAFFGCKHFSKTNELLIKQGRTPINWNL